MPKKQNKRRSDGRIAVQVYLGRRADGTREYKTVYGKTQKEADEKAFRLKISMHKGIDVSSNSDTFGEWAERWKILKFPEISDSWIIAYMSCLKKLSPLNNIAIKDIQPTDIQKILIEHAKINPNTKKPSSRRTLEALRSVAEQVCRLAVNHRVIEFNPVTLVTLPKTSVPHTRRAITTEERYWIENTPHRAQIAAMIMVYAGLRRGEVIPLQWTDIDLNAQTITVCRSVSKVKNKFIIKEGGKTEHSTRVVNIPTVLVRFLSTVPKKSLFVVSNVSDNMLSPEGWASLWESYMNTLNAIHGRFENCLTWKNGKKITRSITEKDKYNSNGLPFVIQGFTAHNLRHTFATMLYFAGVDILTAKEQLGHANVQTTMEVYTHLDQQFKRKSMDKLNTFLENASQMQVNHVK